MADIPDTNPFKGYSFSWTQPYLPTSYNPFYERARDIRLEEEIDRLEMVDCWVDSMLTYPDAERIIKRIQESM
jgi:hypothetical protein